MAKKKLIEVAIPLEAINAASAREKSIRHGHPSTLHLWWARRPLAACRAVLFAQLVDDPSSHLDKFPTEESVEKERKRLFQIIEDLVKWENSTNEEVLERARTEIRDSCDGELPPVYDPFSGGGSIPLEAQRLGLPAYGSDLNPVAVMIGKAMIEIPPKFKDMEPIHPGAKERNHYRNAEGLAEDVKYYGEWIREKAWERIGHLYPQVDLPVEYGGGKATAVAYIWSRTVESPNPALRGMRIPLFKSAWISKKKNNETWVEVLWNTTDFSYKFEVKRNGAPLMDGTVGKTAVTCSLTTESIPLNYVREEGVKGKIGNRLMAVVCETSAGKIFASPDEVQESIALNVPQDMDFPDITIDHWSGCTNCVVYGFDTFKSLYSKRQLAALKTFSDLIPSLHKHAYDDAMKTGLSSDEKSLEDGGSGAKAYADAIAMYIAIAVDRLADRCSMASGWDASHNKIRNTFARHAIPMVWEYAEVNPFSGSTGNWSSCIEWIYKFLDATVPSAPGEVIQENASSKNKGIPSFVLSTDPPYYDNIPYSNLSDYFYMWLRQNLHPIMPRLFSTLSVPKTDELVANRFRHGGKLNADKFFLNGIRDTFTTMAMDGKGDFPVTIYYAFKQNEVVQEGVSSTGWATFLQAVIDSGYAITGTWPIRTELANRMRSIGSNALANSVVLVCRAKP
ncbi:DUF1156 domain-containing protein, partial [Litoricolaceae bacterium]|nr:DUF1156 domain-containing protein [Litorivicinaceae bacterium]